MQSFLDPVRERRSTGSYSSQPVPEEAIRSIIELALLSPSTRNLQPWNMIVVTDEERRKQLAEVAAGHSFVAEEHRVFAMLPLGYAAQTRASSPRNAFEQVTCFERHGGARSEGT